MVVGRSLTGQAHAGQESSNRLLSLTYTAVYLFFSILPAINQFHSTHLLCKTAMKILHHATFRFSGEKGMS